MTTDWPAFWAKVRAEMIHDVTGRPDLLPNGEMFTLHHSDGTVGLVMPRDDVLAYIAHPNTPHVYVRELVLEPPF